jgi:hypothetical protein
MRPEANTPAPFAEDVVDCAQLETQKRFVGTNTDRDNGRNSARVLSILGELRMSKTKILDEANRTLEILVLRQYNFRYADCA